MSLSTYRTTLAARSAAPEITRVCGVPFCSEDFDKSVPLGLNALRKSGSWSRSLVAVKEEVSRNAESVPY
jgi:hypothetical protein